MGERDRGSLRTFSGGAQGRGPPTCDHPLPDVKRRPMTADPPVDLEEAARLLDDHRGEELLATAAEHAGARLIGATRRSVHLRAGRSLSHVHEGVLEVAGSQRASLLVAHVDLRGFPEGAFVLTCDGISVAVWRFPHDPYLPGLPSAISTARVRELLDDLGALPGDVSLRTRAYRPSRRAVVEVTVRGSDAVGRILYLKVLAGDRANELADLHRQLVPHVPVPRVIGVAGAQGILAIEALDGPTLRAALVAGTPLPDPEELVQLSQRFAASGLVSHRDPTAFADPTRHVSSLARLVPDRAGVVATIAAAVALEPDAPRVPVHGDLHDGQLLLDADGHLTGLLDVDGAGPGSIAQDAGNLVAHLAVIGEVWPDAAERAEAYASEVAEAYRPLVGSGPLARATAGAWLGLATGSHRAQDEGWEVTTRARIDRARRELP
jgi:hypothetical protein